MPMNPNSADYNPDDTIIALATPPMRSAIAVIRISGAEAIEKTARLFSRGKTLLKTQGNTALYGEIIDPSKVSDNQNQPEILDQVILTLFRAPKSYTGENSIEISTHGSPPIIRAILDLFINNGFRQAAPGEFTFRAFFNKKIDLTRAEAVHELISAKTRKAGNLAYSRLAGSVETRVKEIRNSTIALLAWVELHLDYPDDEIEAPPFNIKDVDIIIANIKKLSGSYATGKLYQEGITVVLAGKTNAGKSSLFNLILKEERSIVSEIEGTTRDFLESEISLDGIPLKLFDTAGLRDTDNPIETEGIKRTEGLISESDLILYLYDATNPENSQFSDNKTALHCEADSNKYLPKEKTVTLWNKIDHPNALPVPKGAIGISAETGEGFPELEKQIKEILFKDILSSDEMIDKKETIIDSKRQKDLLDEALDAFVQFKQGYEDSQPLDLLAEDLQSAVLALSAILGEKGIGDILETMFSKFCVGK